MSDVKEPCGNEDCDTCNPLPRWEVSTESVRRVVHRRRIKAATAAEALAIYEQGTAWPSSYDDAEVEMLEEKPSEVKPEELDDWTREYHRTEHCFHRLEHNGCPHDCPACTRSLSLYLAGERAKEAAE